ncbi:hypothetical protein HY733_03075 [Candidatus Uhrbacteria bacterium]|nr:hypothetical protein [Candidatus Uhrbacteria bacterium]
MSDLSKNLYQANGKRKVVPVLANGTPPATSLFFERDVCDFHGLLATEGFKPQAQADVLGDILATRDMGTAIAIHVSSCDDSIWP